MLDNEQVILRIRRNPLFLLRGALDLLIAGFFFNLYRSAISAVPFWDDWRLVELYRNMMEDFFDQIFAVPASWIGAVLAMIALYFLFHALRRLLNQLSSVYTLSNLRVMKKVGVFGVTTHELLLGSIDGVSRQQSILGRLLGYGTLRIAGRGVDVLEWHYVSDLAIVKETLEKRLMTVNSKVPTLESSINS